MQLSNFTYLALLVLTISYPIIKTREEKLQFYKKLRYIIPAIIITAIPFLIWDVIFESHHIWSFSPEHTMGINVLGLPLEEWLFFFIIPYACFFIYETLKYFTGQSRWCCMRYIAIIVAIILLIISILANNLSYTFVSFLLASLILFIIAWRKQIANHLTNFFKRYLVSLMPFFLVNGVLTKMPVVLYNNQENLSLRIYSIPIEDMVYLLSLLFINFALYEIFRQYDAKRQAEAENGN